ncbi:hypothetical protein AAY473_010559 [Plecturocebus cupreus]
MPRGCLVVLKREQPRRRLGSAEAPETKEEEDSKDDGVVNHGDLRRSEDSDADMVDDYETASNSENEEQGEELLPIEKAARKWKAREASAGVQWSEEEMEDEEEEEEVTPESGPQRRRRQMGAGRSMWMRRRLCCPLLGRWSRMPRTQTYEFTNLPQVIPKSENSSQPAKKAKEAAKAKQQLQKQQHPKKTSFQKLNGISKGADSEFSTMPSVTKTQASSRLQNSNQTAGKAKGIREPKVTGKLKQQSPKLQSSKKVAFLKQNAIPKGTDTETLAVLSPSKTRDTLKPKDHHQPFGRAKGVEKQQLAEQPFKKAAFQKQNDTPKGPQSPTVSPVSSSHTPHQQKGGNLRPGATASRSS